MPARLLAVGADALDFDLVRHFAREGAMPVFERLLDTGATGVSQAPPGLYAGAVWPSFWTSCSPARHARYCYEQVPPGGYEKVRIHPTDAKAPPFWAELSAAGRRVAVVDVPKSYVHEGLCGVQVVDWGAHDPDYDGPVTWPPDLRDEIVARHGRDAIGNCNRFSRDGAYAQLREGLVARARARARLVREIIARDSWDAVIAVFSESHCAGHQFWHVHDPSHARHDPEQARALGDPLRDVYAAVDAAVGEILDSLGAETTVLVFGSHGMRSHYDATFLLDEMLHRIERPGAPPRPQGKKRRPLAKRAWAHLPPAVRGLLAPLKEPVKAQLGLEGPAARRYFAVPNGDACGAIRLNVAGREPSGRVRAEEFDAVCDALARDLRDFVNADNGAPVVRDVWRVRDAYEGPAIAHLPDLIVEWNRDAPVSRVRSPKAGEIHRRHEGFRTGDHTPRGFFCVTGPGVVAGPVSPDVSVMDYGPTIAERLGVALRDVDGRSFAARVFAGGPAA